MKDYVPRWRRLANGSRQVPIFRGALKLDWMTLTSSSLWLVLPLLKFRRSNIKNPARGALKAVKSCKEILPAAGSMSVIRHRL